MACLSLDLACHMDGIDNVVFDVGNVLFRFDMDHITNVLLPEKNREKLAHALFADDHRWRWVSFDEGILSDEQVAKNIADEEGIPDAWTDVLTALYHFHEDRVPLPLAKNIPVLKEMGKKVYGLTNYNARAFELAREKFSFFSLMDGIVVSGEEKVCKPDRKIYEILLNRYHLDAEKTLFIDDNQNNIEGAEKTGIRGWHYITPDVK